MNEETIYVPAGADRFQVVHQAFGLKPIDFKVSSKDTNGRFLSSSKPTAASVDHRAISTMNKKNGFMC